MLMNIGYTYEEMDFKPIFHRQINLSQHSSWKPNLQTLQKLDYIFEKTLETCNDLAKLFQGIFSNSLESKFH